MQKMSAMANLEILELRLVSNELKRILCVSKFELVRRYCSS